MKLFLFLLAFVSSTALAADRVIVNPDQDGNLLLKVNDGGTVVDSIKIEGTDSSLNFSVTGGAVVGGYSATGAWTFGKATSGPAPGVTVQSDGSSTLVVNRTTAVGSLGGIEIQGAGTKITRWLANSSFALEIENTSSVDVFTVTHLAEVDVNRTTANIKLGNGSGSARAGIFMSTAVSGEACDVECDALAASHGFGANDAHCLGAFNNTNTDELTCAGVDAVPKTCLCAGAIQSGL